MATLTVGSHGEVVIPKPVRERLGLRKGSKVDYQYANNMLTICPSISTRTNMDDDFDRIRDAYLADGVSLDDMYAALRELYESNE